MRRWLWALVAVMSVWTPSLSEAAVEAACTTLGAKCGCSLTLAATSGWTTSGVPTDFRRIVGEPADSRACGNNYAGSGFPGVVFYQASGSLTSTTMTVPTGTINATQSSMDAGAFDVFPEGTQKTGTGRSGARFYITLGSGYQSTGEGVCSNDKYSQIGDYLTAYGTGFTSSNGGGFSPNITPSMLVNKVWSLEWYLDTYSNPATFTAYARNITDNLPAQSFSVPARLALDPANLTITSAMHRYRAGPCNGTFKVAYALYARNLSPGERIPAATEVEGGGGTGADTTTPTQVTGITAIPGNGQVQLSGMMCSDNVGVGGFGIERATVSTGPFTSIAITGAGGQTNPTNISYLDTGLTNGTTYYYRANCQDTASPANIGPYSVTVSATPAAISGTTVLTTTANGKFALNGMSTTLKCISYYDASNYHTSDVDYFTGKGLNCFIIHIDDVLRNNPNSGYNADGTLKGAKETAFNNFITYVDGKASIVVINCLYSDSDGANSATYISNLTAAVTNCVSAFKSHGNVAFSVTNEHNLGAFSRTHNLVGSLMAAARAACSTCLLWFSSTDTAASNPGDGGSHMWVSQSSSAVDNTILAEEVSLGLNAVAPHDSRASGWEGLVTARYSNLRSSLVAIGRGDLPIIMEEPARELSGGCGSPSSAACYLTAYQNAVAAGAAGVDIHTDAAFDLSSATAVSQLAAITSSVVDGLAGALSQSGGFVRDTALHTQACNGTAADIGAAWDAGYTGHDAWQTVSGRCRTSGAGNESLESYNGTIQANMWIQGEVPSFTLSGTYTEFRAGFYTAPATVSGYECRFGKIPSDTVRITRKDNNNPTTLATTTSTALNVGDTYGCERVGSTITAFKGSTAVLSATDTTYTQALRPGFYGYAELSGTAVEVDNVTLGNMIAAPTITTPVITGLTLSTTGYTATYTGSLGSCRLSTQAGDTIYTVGSGQCTTLVRAWTVADGAFACLFARDTNGVENTNPSDYLCVNPQSYVLADTTPPVLSNPQPNGQVFSAGTTSVIGTWNTNEAAVCKIGTSDVAYDSLPTTVETVATLSHTYAITGLTNGASFAYYPECMDSAGNKSSTSFVLSGSVATPPVTDSTPPSTITNFAATIISSTQIQYTWTAPTDNVLVSFVRFYVCADPVCATKSVAFTIDGPASGTTYSGLTPSAQYVTCVTAVDSSGNESAACSNVSTAQTLPLSSGDVTSPSNVAGFAAGTVTYSSVPLVWTAGTDVGTGIAYTKIRRCTGAGCTDFGDLLTVYGASTLSVTDSAVVPMTTYRYEATHVDGAGNASASPAIIQVTTLSVPVTSGIKEGLCNCRHNRR